MYWSGVWHSYLTPTGECTGIKSYTGMETSQFAQHQNNPPDLIFMFSQQLHYLTFGLAGSLKKKTRQTNYFISLF